MPSPSWIQLLSITRSTISLSTKREENLGRCSTLTSMTTFVYWQMPPLRRTSLMRGRSLRGVTIKGTSIFSLLPGGRWVNKLISMMVVSSIYSCTRLLSDISVVRFTILKGVTESIPSLNKWEAGPSVSPGTTVLPDRCNLKPWNRLPHLCQWTRVL